MLGNYFDGTFLKLVLAVLAAEFIWSFLHGWPFAILVAVAAGYLAYLRWFNKP